ncbi:MAG: glyoxalase/bleomycin resistance protein/dioxygenase [Devosia sp.]|jgi:catechol 2,3-dioxygenase-like lactoylglutathione lyase family enzyme|nr:glyoxalase/bleomycin resistance protein/dioxygenase [Devosia sp.]
MGGDPALIPELGVADLSRSLNFYCDLLGFAVRYERPAEGFAMLEREGALLMLDQLGLGRDWQTGSLEPPFGRGINLQIRVSALDPVLEHLAAAGVALFMPVETKTYQAGSGVVRQRQFCVQDPDGYLLRFAEIG